MQAGSAWDAWDCIDIAEERLCCKIYQIWDAFDLNTVFTCNSRKPRHYFCMAGFHAVVCLTKAPPATRRELSFENMQAMPLITFELQTTLGKRSTLGDTLGMHANQLQRHASKSTRHLHKH